MTEFTSVASVFEKYGLTLLSAEYPSIPITSLEDVFNLSDFASVLFSNSTIDFLSNTYTRDHFFRDYVAHKLTYNNLCKITNLDKWFVSFGINPDDCPFPTYYLSHFPFVFFEPDDTESLFIIPFEDTGDIASALNKSPYLIRKELCPTYEVASVFLKTEANTKANKEIAAMIEKFDNLPDVQRTNAFKEDLFQAVLKVMTNKLEKHLDSPLVANR